MSMFFPLAATNIKLSNKNVLAPQSLGKVRLEHSDIDGFTLFTNGKKRPIAPASCTPELRDITSSQLAAYSKAAYISVHEQSDGEFALRSHVRGNGGMKRGQRPFLYYKGQPPFMSPAGEAVGYWLGKTLGYMFVAKTVEATLETTKGIVVDGVGILQQPGKSGLQEQIDKGGAAGAAANVVSKGCVALCQAEAAACAGAAGAAMNAVGQGGGVATTVVASQIAAATPNVQILKVEGVSGPVPVASALPGSTVTPIYPTPTGQPLFANTINSSTAAMQGSSSATSSLAKTVAASQTAAAVGETVARGYAGDVANAQFNAQMQSASEQATAMGVAAVAAAGAGGAGGIGGAIEAFAVGCGKIVGLFF
jgi:hypothetical protein